MPRLSQILTLATTALSLLSAGCTTPLHIGWAATHDPPAAEPIKRQIAERPYDRNATEKPKEHVAAKEPANTPAPRPDDVAPKVAVPASREALNGALAQLDAMPTLSPEERAQLKQDLSRAKPEDVQALLAVVRLVSEREAKAKTKEPAPIAKVAHVEPAAPEPLPIPAPQDARPIAAPAPLPQVIGPSAPPSGPLPQIIGPNEGAPPITILPPGAYPGAPNYAPGLPGAPGVQPQIVVNPLVPATFPPFGQPAPQPMSPPAYFPAVPAQPLIPATPYQPFPAPIAPAPNEGTTAPASFQEAVPPGNWSKSLRDALKELERELAATKPKSDKDASVDQERGRKAILVRLLRLASGDQDGAVRRLDELPPDEQEFWTHQIHALGISLDPDGPPVASRRAALALRELRHATARLANQATLEVRNLVFCSEVIGFGHYQRFPNVEFEPEQEVLLYAEIDNLQASESKAGFRTNFQATLQVLDAAGKVVHDHSYPAGEDLCSSRRRDFFVPFRTYIPKLSPGEYTLQLTVEDIQAKKFGQNTISFRIKRG